MEPPPRPAQGFDPPGHDKTQGPPPLSGPVTPVSLAVGVGEDPFPASPSSYQHPWDLSDSIFFLFLFFLFFIEVCVEGEVRDSREVGWVEEQWPASLVAVTLFSLTVVIRCYQSGSRGVDRRGASPGEGIVLYSCSQAEKCDSYHTGHCPLPPPRPLKQLLVD